MVPFFLGAVAGACTLLRSRHNVHKRSSGHKANRLVRLGAAKADASEALPFVTLTNTAGDTAKIYTYGACIASYIKDGHEMLALRKDNTFDGSKPISGGIPICFPRFGKSVFDDSDKIPGHGFARSMPWFVEEMTDGAEPRLVLKLTDNAETRKQWDHSFEATYIVTLKSTGLETVLHVKNTGSSHFDFTAGLHSYWKVSDISNAKVVGGFGGKKYLKRIFSEDEVEMVNSVGNELTKDEFMTMNEGGLPHLYTDYSGDVMLQDSGTSRGLTIQSTGWSDVALWSPWGNEKMGYKGFIGIEAVQASQPIQLSPSEEWIGKMDVIPAAL